MSDNIVVRSVRKRLAWLLPLTLFGAVMVIGVSWGGLRVVPVRAQLTQAVALMVQLRDQLSAGDTAAARITVTSLRRLTAAARDGTDGADWNLASALPEVGDDLAAVAVVAAVLDDLAANALEPAVSLAEALTPEALLPDKGLVSLAQLATAAQRVVAVDVAVRAAAGRLAAIDLDGLMGPLRDGVVRLREGVAHLGSLTATAARMVTLAPSMLGLSGARTY